MINSFKNVKIKRVLKEQLINVLEFVDNSTLVTLNGDLQIGFELSSPEIYSLSQGQFEKYAQSWISIIKKLPPGYVLHRQDIFFKKTFSDLDTFKDREKDDFLTKSSYRHFADRQYLDHRTFLFVTRLQNDLDTSKPIVFKAYNTIKKNLLDPKIQTAFNEVIMDVKAILDANFEYRNLSKESYYDLHNKYLNFDFKDDSHKEIFRESGNCYVGGEKIEVFCVKTPRQLPDFTCPYQKEISLSSEEATIMKSFLSPIAIGLPIEHVVNQYIYIQDKEKSIKDLRKLSRQAKAFSNFEDGNLLMHEDIESYISELAINDANPVRYHLNCIFKTNIDNREEHRQLVRRAFDAVGIEKVESCIPALLYFYCMPCNVASLPKEKTFFLTPKQGACFLGLDSSQVSKPGKYAMRMADRLQGKPIWVDLHNEPFKKGYIHNRNKFVLGPAGSGKSFFMNHLVKSFYEDGGHVLIIDMGGSYFNNCEVIKEESLGQDGIYLEYTEENPLSFNPFFLPLAKDTYDLAHIELIKAVLIQIWKEDGNQTSKYEQAALKEMIISYGKYVFTNKIEHPCFSNFYKHIYENFLQGEDGLFDKEKFNLEEFVYVTSPFVHGGKYEFLLNAKENIDLLKKRFVVFEIDTIRNNKDLLPIVTIMIMYLFENKMRNLKSVPKMMVIEEAWSALLRTEMAEYILYLVKTVRKFDGQTVFVTQELKDLTKSEIVKDAIVSNSDCKVLLDQRKFEKNFEVVKTTLGLTEFDTNQILSINRGPKRGDRRYKELWIGLGVDSSQVYALEVSKAEYYAYTSDRTDKELLEKRKQEYGSTMNAINCQIKNEEKNKTAQVETV